jgi:hypothetical protein
MGGHWVSEYQYVAFRAVDRPLTDKELKFAEQQSTRAEITRWSFQNEYHFGDFRGDVNGLLRHGYDVHLHYANFGIRTVAFRLLAGLPFPKSLWSQYIGTGELAWTKDRRGNAGIVSLRPYHDAGEIEEIWSPGEYMDDMVEMRNRLVAGDLRALYVLWLCAAMDDQSVEPDVVEPPVPGGLSQSVEVFGPFMEFFGLDPLIVLAAAEGTPDAPVRSSDDQLCCEWTEELSEVEAKRLLRKFLTEDATAVKAETIATIRQGGGASGWPTVSLGRTFQMLLDRTEQLRADHEAKEQKKRKAAARSQAAKKERERQARMKKMVDDPQAWLRKSSELVDARGTANYKAAAEILADLREAIGGESGDRITREHAAHLTKEHPTLTHLKSQFRKRGLLE